MLHVSFDGDHVEDWVLKEGIPFYLKFCKCEWYAVFNLLDIGYIVCSFGYIATVLFIKLCYHMFT